MTIKNTKIAALVAAVEGARARKDDELPRLEQVADCADYLEALTTLEVPFNAQGIAVKGSQVIYFGKPRELAEVASELATAAWDAKGLEELAAAFKAALEQAAQ